MSLFLVYNTDSLCARVQISDQHMGSYVFLRSFRSFVPSVRFIRSFLYFFLFFHSFVRFFRFFLFFLFCPFLFFLSFFFLLLSFLFFLSFLSFLSSFLLLSFSLLLSFLISLSHVQAPHRKKGLETCSGALYMVVIATNRYRAHFDPLAGIGLSFLWTARDSFHLFADCRLLPLFEILGGGVRHRRSFTLELYIYGPKYKRSKREIYQLLHFIFGQAKLAVWLSRKVK